MNITSKTDINIKTILRVALATLLFLNLTSCSSNLETIEVRNTLSIDRDNEIIEIPLSQLNNISNFSTTKNTNNSFVIISNNKEIPYQITYDNKLIFPVSILAHSTSTYKLEKGIPSKVDTLCCGSYRKDRKDDLIWENDKAGYRSYGPAIKDENLHGYDVFTKSVSYPVMTDRFNMTLYGDNGKNKKSFHIDYGNGMDSYGVGSTLGCGGSALITNGEIYYGGSWKEYKILDNGPLRFTVRFKMYPKEINGEIIDESRIISIDAGSFFNRAEVKFDGLNNELKKEASIMTGVVIHKENPDAYFYDLHNGYLGYADLGDRNIGKNGEIYCGVVYEDSPLEVGPELFKKPIGSAIGHICGIHHLNSDNKFNYYFGSSWSKGYTKSITQWEEELKNASLKLKNPIEIKIKH